MTYYKEEFPTEVKDAYKEFLKYLDLFQRVYNGERITEETTGYRGYDDYTLSQFAGLLSWSADDLEDVIDRWENDDDDWDENEINE